MSNTEFHEFISYQFPVMICVDRNRVVGPVVNAMVGTYEITECPTPKRTQPDHNRYSNPLQFLRATPTLADLGSSWFRRLDFSSRYTTTGLEKYPWIISVI